MTQEKPIVITVIIKDGGYETIGILPSMPGPLSAAIRTKGYEVVQLPSKSLEIAGILVTSREVGERIIVLGMEGVKS